MRNNPFNFFRYWRKHGWKKTVKQWKYNFVMLDTPDQLMRKEIIGYLGAMCGVVFAGVVFWFKGSRQLIPLFCFSLWIMYVNFKKTAKQLMIYRSAKNILEEPKEEDKDNVKSMF